MAFRVRADKIVFTFLFMYIFMFINETFLSLPSNRVSNIFVYLFLAAAVLTILIRRGNITLDAFASWFVFFTIIMLVSLLYTPAPSNALEPFFTWMKYGLIVFMVSTTCTEEKHIQNIIWFYCVSIAFLAVWIFAFKSSVLTESTRLGTTTLGNANNFVRRITLGAMMMFVAVKRQSKVFPKIIWLILAILAGIICLLSGTRTNIAALLIFILLFAMLINRNKRVQTIFLIILALIAAYGIISALPVFENVIIRFEKALSGSGTLDQSDQNRVFYVKYAFQMFLDKPFFGWGLNAFTYYIGTYSHCNFMEVLASFGIVGFCIYYSIYAVLLRNLIIYNKREPGMLLPAFFISALIAGLFLDVGTISYYLLDNLMLMGLVSAWLKFQKSKCKEIQYSVCIANNTEVV